MKRPCKAWMWTSTTLRALAHSGPFAPREYTCAFCICLIYVFDVSDSLTHAGELRHESFALWTGSPVSLINILCLRGIISTLNVQRLNTLLTFPS